MPSKFRRVFWISLITLSNIYYGLSPFISLLVIKRGVAFDNIALYRDLTTLVGFGVTLATVTAGYRFGKKADIENQYMQYIKDLGAGWIASTILVLPVFLSPDEIWRGAAQGILVRSATSGYETGAIIFSGIVLGRLIDDRFKVSREWNTLIIRPLIAYNGVKFIGDLIRTVLVRYSMIYGISVSMMGSYSFLIALVTYPIWLWYLRRMLSAGRKINLAEEYGSVLFTIWAISVAKMTLKRISNALLYQSISGLADLLEFLFDYALNLIGSTVGVFGLAFALICLGYVNTRHRYAAELNESGKGQEHSPTHP